MKCDIVFHPATTTMSRCCNMPFVKRRWQDISCLADGMRTSQASNVQKHSDDFGKKNLASTPSIDLLLTMRNSHLPLPPCCLATHPQDNTPRMGDTGGDLVEHSPPGHVSIITGLQAVMRQNTKHVLQGWLLTDDRGESCRKAAVAFDLLAPRWAVMRSNSVLTPLRLPSPPLPPILSPACFTFACGNLLSFCVVCHQLSDSSVSLPRP